MRIFVITPQIRAWLDQGLKDLEAYANGEEIGR